MDGKADPDSAEVPLEGKVALLFIGADAGGPSLAVSLAKSGADVAIVYRLVNYERALEAKKIIEVGGRRCLIIPARDNGETSSEEVIRQTINRLGRLDIFIDYSSFPRPEIGLAKGVDRLDESDGVEQTGPFTNVELMSAVLDQIVRTERTDTADDEPDDNDEKKQMRSKEKMLVAKELINKPVFSVNDGQKLGKVQDFYLDQELSQLTAIYLSGEGLISRKESLIKWPDVVTMGEDAILVKDADCVMEMTEVEELETYLRRDNLNGRPVNTPGGTKIGRIGDIILDDEAKVAGYSLTQVFVSGPIAANRAINRAAVVENANEDGVMTADLSEAEKANLKVVHEGFFAEPTVNPAESETASAEA